MSMQETPGVEAHPPVVIVTGPTAGGKSGLALELAEAFGGVVINADSMQVYRELEILTARPGATALARAPHRLYGTLSGGEPCSAGRWRALALTEIAAAHRAGKPALVVGGTGLYLRALIEGLAEVPEVPAALREAAEARYRELGGPGLHGELAARDPAMAARLRPSDRQRLIRAWEVLEATGRSLAAWQADSAPKGTGYRFLRLVRLPPRDQLYAACDARFLDMIERGALREVGDLYELGLDPKLPVMRALGVRELGRYLDDALSLDEAIVRAQQATRNYAKRQMTWLRTQSLPDSVRTVILDEQHSKSIEPKIFANIRQFLLTP